MSVRRNVLNVVRNYSDAEIKVREATSNDAWGPSSSLMSEIADMTYNVSAFADIMAMIWKRVNDHGKNWRHVYKALVLLDYLIKTGSERVSTQCKENIYAIQTLKDFQFVDRDAKDQGSNVREKSKQLVSLLKDDERLKSERTRALKAKERFAQATTGIGSDRTVVYGHGSSVPVTVKHHEPSTDKPFRPPPKNLSEIEQARPHTATEEELQLQLALTMSKEEAEMEKKKQESDQVRLELAISESQKLCQTKNGQAGTSKRLVDLTAAAKTLQNPWGDQEAPVQKKDPFLIEAPTNDPWSCSTEIKTAEPANDPWLTPADPWAPPNPVSTATTQPSTIQDDFDLFDFQSSAPSNKPLQPVGSSITDDLMPTSVSKDLFPLDVSGESVTDRQKRNAENFLGGALSLVNLDSLVTRPVVAKQPANPFLDANNGPIQPTQVNSVSLNQMRGAPIGKGPTSVTTISVAPTISAPQMMPASMATYPTTNLLFPSQPSMPAFSSQNAFITGQPAAMLPQQPTFSNQMMATNHHSPWGLQQPTSNNPPPPSTQSNNNPFFF